MTILSKLYLGYKPLRTLALIDTEFKSVEKRMMKPLGRATR